MADTSRAAAACVAALLFSSSVILSRRELSVLSVRWRWAAVSL